MNQNNVKLISSSKDAGRSWKTGSFLIIVLLMISILTVSFYEPKWVHSGTFAGVETDESEFGIEPPIEKSKSFQFDDLRDLITSTSRRSKQSGALQSFTVTPSTLMYNSNEYLICKVVSNRINKVQKPSFNAIDPLSPKTMEKDLIVYDFSKDSHEYDYTLALNKYNTIPDHTLLISNQFHPQIGFINKKEFALWLWIILKIKGIGFYNSNKIAGASQPHKHLQIIPKDSVSKLYKEASSSAQSTALDQNVLPKIRSGDLKLMPTTVATDRIYQYVTKLSEFPFVHALIPFNVNDLFSSEEVYVSNEVKQFGGKLEAALHQLIRAVKLDEKLISSCENNQKTYNPNSNLRTICDDAVAYNVILTANYLLVVPRSKLAANDNVNGLGYLGIFLATSADSEKKLKEAGPIQILKSVSKVEKK